MNVENNHNFIDHLTGIYTKDFFFEAGDYILQLAIRNNNPLSLCIVNIDDLNIINKNYSHGIGNQILEAIAQIIIHNCRESDIIAYLGDGKIGFLLSNISSSDTELFLNELRKKVENHEHVFMDKKVKVTISIGACMVHNYKNIKTFYSIYEQALKALA